MITNPQRIGDDGQRGVNGTTGRKEAAIYHVEIIDIMGLTIQIQHGGCGVFAKLTGADLVTDAFHWEFAGEVSLFAPFEKVITVSLDALSAVDGLQNFNPALFEAIAGF